MRPVGRRALTVLAALAIGLMLVIGFAIRSILMSRDATQPRSRRPVPTRPD